MLGYECPPDVVNFNETSPVLVVNSVWSGILDCFRRDFLESKLGQKDVAPQLLNRNSRVV